MTPADVNELTDWIALSAAIPAILFTLVYGFGSAWYKSGLGITLFGLMFSISSLLAVILPRRFFGEYPGYHIVAVVVYVMLTLMFWSFFIILLKERRHARPLEIPLQRTPTRETEIITKEQKEHHD